MAEADQYDQLTQGYSGPDGKEWPERRLDSHGLPQEIIEVPVAVEESEEGRRLRYLTTTVSFALAVWAATAVYDDVFVALLLALVFGAVTHFPFWLASRFFGRGAVYFWLQWRQDRRLEDGVAAAVFAVLSGLSWVLLAVVLYLLYRLAPGA